MSFLCDKSIKRRCQNVLYDIVVRADDYDRMGRKIPVRTRDLTLDEVSNFLKEIRHEDKVMRVRELPENVHLVIERGTSISCRKVTPMISPFQAELVRSTEHGIKIPSYGISSYGYDVRLGRNFKVYHRPTGGPGFLDSREFDMSSAQHYEDVDYVMIPGYGFALGVTMEKFCIPRDTLVVCLPKSTLARQGIFAIVTPLEPEWEGHVTIEIFNMLPMPMRLWTGDGVMQMLFSDVDDVCETSYAERSGKYQNQPAVPVAPRM